MPDANVKTEAFAFNTSQLAEAPAGVQGAATDAGPMLEPTHEDAPIASPMSGGGRTVTFAKSGRAGVVTNGTTILEAAEALGVDIPFECRAGVCGQCKTKLRSGTVTMDSDEALSRSEKTAGWILACQAHPGNGDVAVEA